MSAPGDRRSASTSARSLRALTVVHDQLERLIKTPQSDSSRTTSQSGSPCGAAALSDLAFHRELSAPCHAHLDPTARRRRPPLARRRPLRHRRLPVLPRPNQAGLGSSRLSPSLHSPPSSRGAGGKAPSRPQKRRRQASRPNRRQASLGLQQARRIPAPHRAVALNRAMAPNRARALLDAMPVQ